LGSQGAGPSSLNLKNIMKDSPRSLLVEHPSIKAFAFGKGKILATEKNYEILINTP
jgi:hypothetical protein